MADYFSRHQPSEKYNLVKPQKSKQMTTDLYRGAEATRQTPVGLIVFGF
jgi:hypothetical protein